MDDCGGYDDCRFLQHFALVKAFTVFFVIQVDKEKGETFLHGYIVLGTHGKGKAGGRPTK